MRRHRISEALGQSVDRLTFSRLVAIVISTLTAAGLLAGAARGVASTVRGVETRDHAESTFVRRDSLALWRQRDSLNLKATIELMQRDVSALVRACQRDRKCP